MTIGAVAPRKKPQILGVRALIRPEERNR